MTLAVVLSPSPSAFRLRWVALAAPPPRKQNRPPALTGGPAGSGAKKEPGPNPSGMAPILQSPPRLLGVLPATKHAYWALHTTPSAFARGP